MNTPYFKIVLGAITTFVFLTIITFILCASSDPPQWRFAIGMSLGLFVIIVIFMIRDLRRLRRLLAQLSVEIKP